MNKTKIEWADYTVNPVKGYCPVGCEYCYARRMYDRFGWDKTIRYDPVAWLGLGNLTKPSRVFVGSTFELFHDCIKEQWIKWIMEVPLEFSQHTFIFLTKQPWNLRKWSPFPNNCWVGVSATDREKFNDGVWHLLHVEAKVKFISFEPLLESPEIGILDNGHPWPVMHGSIVGNIIDWFIIGAMTGAGASKHQPKLEWIEEIIEAADKAGIPVFLKDNLHWPEQIRQWPKVKEVA